MYKKTFQHIRDTARQCPQRIIFPECNDLRVLEATQYLKKQKIAIPMLISSQDADAFQKDLFAHILKEHKPRLTYDRARALMDDSLFYGAMLLRLGFADGLVAGASHSTGAVMRALIYCLDMDDRVGLITSCFLMGIPQTQYTHDGILFFADCGVIPSPTSDQLARIAIATGTLVEEILNIPARVAMLSFSSKGSASNEDVNKVREAVDIARSLDSQLSIDGELQADSAIVPEIAVKKIDNSPVAGKANVLIFPNLDSGNISYKLIERLTGARAIGPVILGTLQPCSDLSRGCSVQDIIDSAALTVVRAQRKFNRKIGINLDKHYANTGI
jgi:phosphate acetyltransferase